MILTFAWAYLIIGATVWLWCVLEDSFDLDNILVEVYIALTMLFLWLPFFVWIVSHEGVEWGDYRRKKAARDKLDFELYGC